MVAIKDQLRMLLVEVFDLVADLFDVRLLAFLAQQSLCLGWSAFCCLARFACLGDRRVEVGLRY